MKSAIYRRQPTEPLQPEAVGNLEFSDCIRLIWELQSLKAIELRSQENIKIIKELENRIKFLGKTESYKCMAALPAVNALVN